MLHITNSVSVMINLNNNPILTSILDNDAYKFYVQQAVFHHYNNTIVSAKFECRCKNLLGKYSIEIQTQVEMMSDLRLNLEEFNYLSKFSFLKKDYLKWLRQFKFNPKQVKIYNNSGDLDINITGLWHEIILWEVPLLAIISEIVHRDKSPSITSLDAIKKLHKKLDYFYHISRDIDISRFKLIDFGTRRRFSKQIQFDIIKELLKKFPYPIGTSNYHLARKFNLPPFGTQSHEWFQAHQQISKDLSNSQIIALKIWLDEYPNDLRIALTDCITMDAFLRDFTVDLAIAYQGLRHDSGNPIEWGEKAIAHYEKLDIDPTSKILVFSDNLDFNKALTIYRSFWKRINLIFGIGTKLTCDIPSIRPLNIVIKLIECNGKPVAKLSDSPGKMTCYDRSFIYALRKAFNISSMNEKPRNI